MQRSGGGEKPHSFLISGYSSTKELFSPGQEAAGARPSRAQVKNSSSEIGLLKMVSFGGVWHSEEEDEETLLTNPNLGQIAAKQSWAFGRVTEKRKVR